MSIKKLVLAILIALFLWRFGPILIVFLLALVTKILGGG
jgi:hypothetical protein